MVPHNRNLAWVLPLIALAGTGISCSGPVRRTVIYVRAFRAPIEARGHMRLAQDRVTVNVMGTDEVADLDAAGGYVLIHESDVAGFARDADRLDRSDRAGKLMTAEEYEAIRKTEGAGK